MITATYRYYVDWDGDGDFSEDVEEISAYVMPAFWELYGGDSGNKTGTCRLTLDNSTSIFSSYNPSSEIGLILPNRLVRVTMTIGAGSEVIMWQGKLQSIVPTVGLPVAISTAELIAYGGFDGLSKAEVHLAMQTDKTTGYNAALVLAAADPAMPTTAIDTGLSTMARYWIDRKTNALQALRDLEAAEAGLLRETKDGRIAFESRAHRTLAPHDAAQATYGTGTLNIWRLQQQDHLKGIWNYVEAAVRTFNETEDLVLATLVDVRNGLGGTPPEIAAGATRVVTIEYPAADGSSQYPAVKTWGIVDIEANTAADASGTDITNSSPGGLALSRAEYADRIEITITNNNAVTAYLITLRVHGTAVAEGTPIPVKAQDDSIGGSIALYGKRTYPSPSIWLTHLTEGQDYCDHILAMNKDPRPRISFELEANYDANHLAEAQVRDISDRIHVTAGAIFGLYIDDDFFVEYMGHTVDQGRKHTVRIECSAVVAHTWAASANSYVPKIIPSGIPDDLYVGSIDPSLHCLFSAGAWKYNQNITGARFRAKYFATKQEGTVDLRTIAEGGTLSQDPSSGDYVVDDLIANQYGAQYEFDSPSEGYWYYAFQFKSRAGDSVWTDGNKTPLYVEHYLPTSMAVASGPPADWWVEVEPDPDTHRVRVRASRPKTNGSKIWEWFVQIKDARTYDFVAVNASPVLGTPDRVGYQGLFNVDNGTIVGCASSLDNRRFTRETGAGFVDGHPNDISAVGDLVLFDARGSTFNIAYCSWAAIDSIQGLKTGYNSVTATFFDIQGRFHNTVQSDLRLQIVAAPWNWGSYWGYFGGETNRGWWTQSFWSGDQHGDTKSEVFVSDWIDVPAAVPLSAIRARVFFNNGYSVSDDNVTTGGIVGDTGNPSGAHDLEILTHEDDPAIPDGQIALQWYRETSNYQGIYGIGAWLSTSLPGQGPYDVERDESPSLILETGTCTVVKGNKSVTVTRSASSPAAAVVGKVFLIYTADGTPDSDLAGNVIASEGADKIILTKAFGKSGTFSYAIVQPWWNRAEGFTTNLMYLTFTPGQCAGDIEQEVWRSPCFQAPRGEFYVTLACQNVFGAGTRLTAGPAVAYQGCIPLTPVAGEVTPNANLGSTFSVDTGGNPLTINNPLNSLTCGRPILIIVTGTGTVTLGDKWNLMDGETIARSSGRDMLGGVYSASEDLWDAFWKKGA